MDWYLLIHYVYKFSVEDGDSEGREDSEVPTMYYSKSIAIQHII